MTQIHVDFSQLSSSPKPPPLRLSALLEGHMDDVRSLTSAPDSLFSSSRDGTARRWVRAGANEGTAAGWRQAEVYQGFHQGFVNSVTWLKVEGNNFLATGGQDSTIQVYEFAPPTSPAPNAESPAPFTTLLGHMSNVCCLHASRDGTRLLSGSWDLTARVWDTADWSCRHVLTEHGAAVWDVLAIDAKGYDDSCLTACADGLIRLWKGAEMKMRFKGHTEAVRALAKVLPDEPDGQLFASASNDGSSRIWNFDGNCLTTLPGHGDDRYIYSLISMPDHAGGGLASSGEDGIIKLWDDEDGEEQQEILVPAQSVWSLTSLENGDLACGCSDSRIWIFTRDETRTADEVTRTEYESSLAKRRKPAASPALPTVSAEALSSPGTKEGDVKLVETDGTIHAYQWSTASSSWTDLGEVVGGPSPAAAPSAPPAPAPKMIHEGKEYDVVFSIDVKDDEPPLQLPFDFGDDIHDTAEQFVKQHALPESYTEQIEQFIRFNSPSRKVERN